MYCYRYLTDHIPDLAVLPVTVSISLLNKGIQVPDVRLKPQDRYSVYVIDVIVTSLKRAKLAYSYRLSTVYGNNSEPYQTWMEFMCDEMTRFLMKMCYNVVICVKN